MIVEAWMLTPGHVGSWRSRGAPCFSQRPCGATVSSTAGSGVPLTRKCGSNTVLAVAVPPAVVSTGHCPVRMGQCPAGTIPCVPFLRPACRSRSRQGARPATGGGGSLHSRRGGYLRLPAASALLPCPGARRLSRLAGARAVSRWLRAVVETPPWLLVCGRARSPPADSRSVLLTVDSACPAGPADQWLSALRVHVPRAS